jgi:hypothetical protein
MREHVWRICLIASLLGGGLAVGVVSADESGGGGPAHVDPYAGYQYLLVEDDGVVAGFTKLAPVLITKGAPPILLENGMTEDESFARWAKKTAAAGTGAGEYRAFSLNHRPTYGKVTSHSLMRCWASTWQALPVINYKGPGTPIQQLMLQCAPGK